MAKWLAFFLLALLIAVEHLYALQAFPGFHFDESWAANFALAIFEKRVHWPLQAMSPYTFAWAHYVAASFFSLFGVNLFVFRLSQVSMALLGIAFLTRTLWKENRHTAIGFLLLVSLFPGFSLNHRFAIELTGFHVLCLGLFFYFYDKRMIFSALFVAWFGVTSHILFFAPALAYLGARILQGPLKERERNAWILWCLGLAPYFAHIAYRIPEAGKAWLLFGFTIVLAFLLLFRGERIVRKFGKRPQQILPILAIPFLVNLLFFLPGEWTLLLSTGLPSTIFPWIMSIGASGIAGYLLWQQREEISGAMLCVIVAGAMMLKPTPRYYECAMLWAVCLMAKSFANLSPKIRYALALSLAINSTLVFSAYFSGFHAQRSVHFLFWKDDSREFLAKQEVANFLGLSGCPLSAITSVDSRIFEPLRFLSHGDWPVTPVHCPWGKALVVVPSSEAPHADDAKFAGGYQLWGLP